MEISKCLKEARIKKNITQEDLAEKLGISRQTISSWENGRSYPDIVNIIKISDIFNISLDKLLKEDEKLVNNMKEKMDTVKSNKAIVFTIILAIIFYGVMYLIQTFIDIPKIDNLFLNIIVSVAFIFGVLIYIFTNVNISNILNKKTSNKTILKIIITIILILTIVFIFSFIEKLTTLTWQIFIIRLCIISVLSMICLFIFKKIDKC